MKVVMKLYLSKHHQANFFAIPSGVIIIIYVGVEKKLHFHFNQIIGGTTMFEEATEVESYLRFFVYGESGTGKTPCGLSCMKNVLCLDGEKGTAHYANAMKAAGKPFSYMEMHTADDVMKAITWLKTHEHDFKTLMIDPITEVWKNLCIAGEGQFPDLKFSFKKWDWIKSRWSKMMKAILSLDMNVYITAHSKVEKSNDDTVAFLTFDAEKSTNFLWDIQLEFKRLKTKTPSGEVEYKNVMFVLRDRTRSLEQYSTHEISEDVFNEAFGDKLDKTAKQAFITEDQLNQVAQLVTDLGLNSTTMEQALKYYFKTELVEELTEDQAKQLITQLGKKLAEKVAGEEAAAKNAEEKAGKKKAEASKSEDEEKPKKGKGKATKSTKKDK
jgi:hypothetical protein